MSLGKILKQLVGNWRESKLKKRPVFKRLFAFIFYLIYNIPIPVVMVCITYNIKIVKLKIMTTNKKKILINFKKAQSLLVKIIVMSENNEYCIDIMQQNLAVIGLLKSVHQMLMENHLNTCFKTAMATKNEKRKQEMTQEILKVTKLFHK